MRPLLEHVVHGTHVRMQVIEFLPLLPQLSDLTKERLHPDVHPVQKSLTLLHGTPPLKERMPRNDVGVN